MARVPIKFEAGLPVQGALELASEDAATPSSKRPRSAAREPPAVAKAIPAVLEPIAASALEGLGLLIVGMVQISINGKHNVVPVGLAPFAGSDTVEVPSAGFFIDEQGRCGILLNGSDNSWQQALPIAVEEARKALQGPSAS